MNVRCESRAVWETISGRCACDCSLIGRPVDCSLAVAIAGPHFVPVAECAPVAAASRAAVVNARGLLARQRSRAGARAPVASHVRQHTAPASTAAQLECSRAQLRDRTAASGGTRRQAGTRGQDSGRAGLAGRRSTGGQRPNVDRSQMECIPRAREIVRTALPTCEHKLVI